MSLLNLFYTICDIYVGDRLLSSPILITGYNDGNIYVN